MLITWNNNQVVTALGKTWHPEHFTCVHCKTELGTKSFFERDGEPYCESDYHNLFSPRCAFCSQPILDVSFTLFILLEHLHLSVPHSYNPCEGLSNHFSPLLSIIMLQTGVPWWYTNTNNVPEHISMNRNASQLWIRHGIRNTFSVRSVVNNSRMMAIMRWMEKPTVGMIILIFLPRNVLHAIFP